MPYFDGSATGLAFDNKINLESKKQSPSLKNILKELLNDVELTTPIWLKKEGQEYSYFSHWPSQGVLLLNTALTVKPKEAGSHTKLWAPFTESLIAELQKKDNIVWILWGNHAKSYKKYITNETHHILEGVHPMPLAANRGGFFGGKYFSKCNDSLTSTGQQIINW